MNQTAYISRNKLYGFSLPELLVGLVIIGILVLVMIGSVVAFVLISMYLPMFKLGTTLQ